MVDRNDGRAEPNRRTVSRRRILQSVAGVGIASAVGATGIGATQTATGDTVWSLDTGDRQ